MITDQRLNRLAELLEREAKALDELCRAMRARRTAYVTLRPQELETAVAALDAQARRARELETERGRLVGEIGAGLGLGDAPRLRELAARAPRALAARLDAAGRAVEDAARAIQVESRVGARLLELAHRVHDGLAQELLGLAPEPAAGSYDRLARRIHGSATGGRLVSGKV